MLSNVRHVTVVGMNATPVHYLDRTTSTPHLRAGRLIQVEPHPIVETDDGRVVPDPADITVDITQ